MAVVLVTGMSGTGKSTALAELERRGYDVLEADADEWAEWGAGPDGRERLWREERMADFLAAERDATLYVSGCLRNQGRFYDRFDAVVLLSAPAEVLLERIDSRTTNAFGRRPDERDLVLRDLRAAEPLLRASCSHELDSTRDVGDVADALVAIGEQANAAGRARSR